MSSNLAPQEAASFVCSQVSFSSKRHKVLAGVLLLSMIASGCAVPLGAGFRLRFRELSFPDLPSTEGPIHLRIADRVENRGNRPLDYLDVSAPAVPARTNLTIQVDAKPIEASPIADDPGAPLRIRFIPPWPRSSSHEIAFSYDLATERVRGGVAGSNPNGFYLADPRALPLWLTPIGVFSSSELLDREERLDVTIPSDFRIITSEKQARRRLSNGNFLYSFRASGKDISPFIVAGRYQERIVQTQHGNLVIWTFRPPDQKTIQVASERLSYAAAIFTRLFGPRPDLGPLRVVEAPDALFARGPLGEPQIAASFPPGVLVSSRALEQGLASEPVMRAAEAELVKVWFGWRVPLRLDAEVLLGRGLGIFATAIAAEGRGGQEARRNEIVRILRDYDRLRLPNDSESLLQSPEDLTAQQLAANSCKAALFLAALDDLAGEDRFERALRRLQDAMAGRGLNLYIDDLRSAVEDSIGKSIPDIFRQWLSNPGIPEDFRSRYTGTAAPQISKGSALIGPARYSRSSGGTN